MSKRKKQVSDDFIPSDDVPLQRSSFDGNWDDALGIFADTFVTDAKLINATTVAGAVLVASHIPGDPLWVFLLGPPSTGKTVVIDSFAMDEEHCESLSKLTATQLISGWKDPENPDADHSIFPRMRNRTLLIKDYTTVLSMAGDQQEQLYGMLRDAYDGHVRIQYGTGKLVDVKDVYFSLLAGVTDKLKEDNNRADLGERFLRCEVIDDRTYDRFAVADAALETSVMTTVRRTQLARLGAAFRANVARAHSQADASHSTGNYPPLEPSVRSNLNYLSQVVGTMRTNVKRKGEEILYRPRVEGGSRVAKQLMKLGISLSYLLDRPSIDSTIYGYIRSVALDTVQGYRLDLCRILMESERGLDSQEIANKLACGKSSTVRLLKDLQAINVVRNRKASNGFSGGRDVYLWHPTNEFRQVWDSAGLNVRTKTKSV